MIETGEGLNRPIRDCVAAGAAGEGVAPRFFESCPAFPGMLPQEIGEKGPRVRAFEGGIPGYANPSFFRKLSELGERTYPVYPGAQ